MQASFYLELREKLKCKAYIGISKIRTKTYFTESCYNFSRLSPAMQPWCQSGQKCLVVKYGPVTRRHTKQTRKSVITDIVKCDISWMQMTCYWNYLSCICYCISCKKTCAVKFLNIRTPQNCCNYPKTWTMWLYHIIYHQCGSRSSLIWVYTDCPGLSVRKFRIITVVCDSWNSFTEW